MNNAVKILLIVILCPIAGSLLSGIDRKITARLQGRMGPSLLQPFYDILKLMCKENIAVSKYQNIFVLIYFVFIVASVIMLFFKMDFLMIIFVYTIAGVALIAGAMSTGSPYSKLGGQREIMSLLSYEPVLIFYAISVYMLTGSFRIDKLISSQKPIIFFVPFIFISMLFIMNIKFKKSPFDFSTSHHAHQELVKGIFTEFSGPALAVIEFAHCYEIIFILGLMFMFWGQNIIIGIAISLFTFLFSIILDNITARLTWQWMFKTSWTVIIGISVVNILGIYLLHLKII